MVEQLFEKCYTKDFAEVYEVPSMHRGYRDLIVIYPLEKGDPFYDGDIVAIDELDELYFFVTVYPYKSLEERDFWFKGLVLEHTPWQKVEL